MRYFIRKTIVFIRRVFRYVPVLWHDVDYDYEPIFEILRLKLSLLRNHFMICEVVSDNDRKNMTKRIDVCLFLIDRILEDRYLSIYEYRFRDKKTQDIKFLFNYMGKYIQTWWCK